jgi:hypothetical protein
MKYRLLIGITVGMFLALGLGTASLANLNQNAVTSSNNVSILRQKAPDCKYPPCD